MTEFQDILYEKHHRVRGTAWLTINRPDLMNSFTGRTLDEMRAAVQDAAADNQVGVLVITGAGDRAFCAGGDVRWLQEVQREGKQVPMDPHAGIEDFLKPVIARVNGYAIGGGNHLAYFCDFTIASDRATFAQVGPRVGSPASGHWVSYLNARRRRQEGEGDLDADPPLLGTGSARHGAGERGRPTRRARR